MPFDKIPDHRDDDFETEKDKKEKELLLRLLQLEDEAAGIDTEIKEIREKITIANGVEPKNEGEIQRLEDKKNALLDRWNLLQDEIEAMDIDPSDLN